MIALATRKRDQLLLRVLYASAGRVSEVCALCWRDAQPSGDSGQLTLFGKGGKTRAIKLSQASHALDRGVSVALVRDTLGYASLAVTSLYTHAKPNESSALLLGI
jgi:site-specific recombinase XerD